MRTLRSGLVACAAVVTLVLLAACSGSGPEATPPASYDGPAPVYVAIGASESLGAGADAPLREAWPQRLHRTLDPQTVFVDVAVAGSTVADAVEVQLPLALELRPSLVTVWLNVNDLLADVPVRSFQADLQRLVAPLRAAGARVLVANTPPVDHLPAYESGAGTTYPPVDEVLAGVDAYNDAIAAVVAATGAELVDLNAAGLAARADGAEAELVSGDGFHPSSTGHERIAQAFADVVG